MTRHVKQIVVPAYLLLCILMGGSSEGTWRTLSLYLLGLGLLGWAQLTRHPEAISKAGRVLAVLTYAMIGLLLLQLVPVPPAVWVNFPGREPVSYGLRLLGEPLPWLPLSMTPYATVEYLLHFIPPMALLFAAISLRWARPLHMVMALLAGCLLSILMGAIQVTTGLGYLYPRATAGQAAGFFANANYLGTLLLISIPFLAATFARTMKRRSSQRDLLGSVGVVGSLLLVVLIGIALSRSLAAVLLLGPVAVASCCLLLDKRPAMRGWLVGAGGALMVTAIFSYAYLPAFDRDENAISVSSRASIYDVTLDAAMRVMPVGSGFGSFVPIYAREEDSASVERAYVNHAHNEYLEIALEGGLPAVLLMLLGLIWWGRCSWSIWGSSSTGSYAKAATIASATILIHSMVDFPARTTAIGSVLAVCLALMVKSRSEQRAGAPTRPARHLSL